MVETPCDKLSSNLFVIQEDKGFVESKYKDSLFYDEIEKLIADYEKTSVFDALQNIDKKLLTENSIAINKFIQSEKNKIDPSDGGTGTDTSSFSSSYPNLNERLNALPIITTAEIIDFDSFSFIGQESFINTINSSRPDLLLSTLNTFFAPQNISKTAMGSFCALVPNIFAKLNMIKNIFSDIQSFANYFSSILQKIQNFSLSGFTVAALIDRLKSQILGLVDKLVEDIKTKIANFANGIKDFIKSEFLFVQTAIFEKITTLKSNIDEFLSDLSVAKMKAKIEGLITHAISTFESLDLEEIQFLILRFCGFIGEMENLFGKKLKPFEDIQSSYNSSYNILQVSGNNSTARAIAAGAIRYNTAQISAGITTVRSIPGGVSSAGPRARRVIEPTAEEISDLATNYSYEKVRAGTNLILYAPGPQSAAGGAAGWNNVLMLEKIMLLRLAKRWGRQIRINSAWRTFGVPRSWHKSGQAFDLNITPSDHDQFARLALLEGFGGIGSYDGTDGLGRFIHIDSRTPTLIYRRGTIGSLIENPLDRVDTSTPISAGPISPQPSQAPAPSQAPTPAAGGLSAEQAALRASVAQQGEAPRYFTGRTSIADYLSGQPGGTSR
jgi:hypothetical protein